LVTTEGEDTSAAGSLVFAAIIFPVKIKKVAAITAATSRTIKHRNELELECVFLKNL
jgi:hypothetical protein